MLPVPSRVLLLGVAVLASLVSPGCDSSPESPATGRLSFYVYEDRGTVSVTVNGASAGTLSQAFPGAEPTCGQAGTLTVTVPLGPATIAARSTRGDTWNATVMVVDACSLIGLPANAAPTMV